MHRFKHFYRLSFAIAWLLLPALANPAVDAAEEYEIKAVYLFHLGGYIYWPDSEAEKFHICLLGENSFGDNLAFVAQEIKTVRTRPVQLSYLSTVAQVDACQVVFISASERLRLPYIFQQLQNKPILTVSDMDRFIIAGGMVQFFRRGSHIRLMLDPQAFTDAGLRPSAHLMRIAKTIEQ